MRLLLLSLRSLRARPVGALLAVLLLAAALACAVLAMLGHHQLRQAFARDRAGVDSVLGAPGDATALVMGSLFQLEAPAGSVPMAQVHALRQQAGVGPVLPLALGDNFRGFRIVGATPEYLSLYGASFADARPGGAPCRPWPGPRWRAPPASRSTTPSSSPHGLAAAGTDKTQAGAVAGDRRAGPLRLRAGPLDRHAAGIGLVPCTTTP